MFDKRNRAGSHPIDQPPSAKGWRAETVASGLPQPWGMAWLADGRMIVTGKKGTLHLQNGNSFQEIPIDGLPNLFTSGQGGLLDIVVHPNDKTNPRVYMTMASTSARACCSCPTARS